MDKSSSSMWTTLDSSDVCRVGRTKHPTSPSNDSIVELLQIDFEQGEKIELTGNIEAEQYSSLQYFSTRMEFKERFGALMHWISNTELNTIYGIITTTSDFLQGNNAAKDSATDTTAKFEDLLIRNIRIPRKYTPPIGSERKKRKSDNPDYTNPTGNFDLACRTPGSGANPYMLEFVLYDCGYDDALKKTKTFEGFAQDLGMSTRIEIFHNTGQNIWTRKTKPGFLLRMPIRRGVK